MMNDEQRLSAWRAFLFTYQTVFRILDQEMQDEFGIALTWYEILARLHGAPDNRIRMQELAGLTLFSRSGLTRLVDRMDNAGLVTREQCPEDRRGTYAVLTDKGSDTFERAMEAHIRGIKRHFLDNMTDDDVRAIHIALTKVLDAELGENEASLLCAGSPQNCIGA
jgi:DNA-binding MarR family transcriptional regulator